MKTRVINGVLCRKIKGKEIATDKDWYVSGSIINRVTAVSGMRADEIYGDVYRPIKKPSKPKAKATGIEAQVCADIAERQRKGIAKYGTTVAENPLTELQWLRHAYEEALDMAVYLRKLIDIEEAKGK